jgi:hypothetical protein
VAYRDELEAAQARADALERELEEARTRIEKLEGRRSTALARRGETGLARSGADSSYSAWAAGPTKLRFETEIDGEVPERAYQELVEVMRRSVGAIGNASTLGKSLSWSATPQHGSADRMVLVTVDSRRGRTVIRVEEQLSILLGRIYGGVLGGVGGGGIMLPILAGLAYPPMIPITLAAWLGGVFGICRKAYAKRARARQQQLGDLFDELVALCEQEIEDAESPEASESPSPG